MPEDDAEPAVAVPGTIPVIHADVALTVDCGETVWFLLCTTRPRLDGGEPARTAECWVEMPRSGAFVSLFACMEKLLPGGQSAPTDGKPLVN